MDDVNSKIERQEHTFRIPYDDKVTHTGQKFDAKDWKVVRFVDREKLVNPNIAQLMVDEIPPKEVDERVVWCNGGHGALGHPKVFINVDQPGAHACGYCGARFIKKTHGH